MAEGTATMSAMVAVVDCDMGGVWMGGAWGCLWLEDVVALVNTCSYLE